MHRSGHTLTHILILLRLLPGCDVCCLTGLTMRMYVQRARTALLLMSRIAIVDYAGFPLMRHAWCKAVT